MFYTSQSIEGEAYIITSISLILKQNMKYSINRISSCEDEETVKENDIKGK